MAVVEKHEDVEQTLTMADRCDTGGCSAAAFVKVSGVSGELLFCGHHYDKAKDSEAMKEFVFDVIDERWVLQNENRAKE